MQKDNLIKKVANKAKITAQKLILKTGVTVEFTQTNLKLICKMYNNTLNIAPNYMPQTRSKLTSAIQDDITTLLKSGKSKLEVHDFYWQVEEFKQLWFRLNLTEKDLENIIDYCISELEKEKKIED